MARFGLISDVHGNFGKIYKAVQMMKDVDTFYHLGDLVFGLSDLYEKVVDLISELGIRGVGGLHDYSDAKFDRNLSERSRKFLASLPRTMKIGDGMLMVHDNPSLDGGYVRDSMSARTAFQSSDARIILIGHTHRAAAFSDDGTATFFEKPGKIALDSARRYILNPGSLGMPRDGPISYASFGILDTADRTFEISRFF